MRGGVAALIKPPGCSSHDVVALVRSRLGLPAGHLGTLDPLAAGVLAVAVGSALRLVRYAQEADKEYRAEVWLGLQSPSDDLDTEISEVRDASGLTAEDVLRALSACAAQTLQRPPDYSARQVGGERAYRAARRGEPLDLPAKPARLREFRIVSYEPAPTGRLVVDLATSAGYYVRSLARDLGERLGVGGLLATLVRTRTGPFRAAQALLLEEEIALLPPEALLAHLPRAAFDAESARRLCQGQRLAAAGEADGLYAAFSGGHLFAVLRRQGGDWRPDTVIGLEDARG